MQAVKTFIMVVLLVGVASFVMAASHDRGGPENHPVPVEIIQDDADAYIVLNSWGDREEHYFNENGTEVRTIIIDNRGNRFEFEYDEHGNLVEEHMPEEIEGEEVHAEEQVITETNEKGVVGILYYDTKDRIRKISEQFVFDYEGVTEYEYYDKMQLKERDGLKGYEWVVKREVSTLVKDGEVRASIIKEFDKDREVTHRETQGLTIMLPIIKAIAHFYGYKMPDIPAMQ